MNPHRNQWRGVVGTKGRVCGACGATAAKVSEQQDHADLFEPAARMDTRTLIAHHTLTEDDS